jgi:hypothetical protein
MSIITDKHEWSGYNHSEKAAVPPVFQVDLLAFLYLWGRSTAEIEQ